MCIMHDIWFLQYRSQCFPEWEKRKIKNKCTCAHFKLAALSSCLIHLRAQTLFIKQYEISTVFITLTTKPVINGSVS